MTARHSRRSLLGTSFVFLLSVLMAFVARGAAAQEATPGASTNMGACTVALGIGAEGDGCINVVHASPDAPLVDIYVDGNLAVSGLGYGWYSGWVALPAGDHQVQVTATGQAPDTAVIDATVMVESGSAYEIAATGLLADIAPQIYPVDLSPTEEGNARIRVIHASPDAPAVDVAVSGGDVLLSNLEFPNASDFLEVPAGTYDLEVRPAGTTDVALALPGVAVEAGMIYDVFAIGQLSDGSLDALIVPATAETASGATPASMTGCAAVLGIGEAGGCINVVHASPDAQAVDVYLDGQLALEGLEFGSFSGWVAVPAGEHQVQVTPAGEAQDAAVIDAMVTLDEGMAYEIAATGLVANIAPQIYHVDLSAIEEGSARIRAIHTSPDAPAVDVAVTGGDVLISSLEFPNASDALVVPAGTYDLEVRPAGTTDVALALPGVEIEAGMVYDVFAIGQVVDGTLTVLMVPASSAT